MLDIERDLDYPAHSIVIKKGEDMGGLILAILFSFSIVSLYLRVAGLLNLSILFFMFSIFCSLVINPFNAVLMIFGWFGMLFFGPSLKSFNQAR